MLKFKLPARWMAGAAMVLLTALTACGGDGGSDTPPAPTLSATMPTTGTTSTAVNITSIVAANGTSMSVDWGDGTKETEPTVTATSLSHTYAAAGSFPIVLSLTGTGTPAQQTGTVVITAPPTLSATLPTTGTTGTVVNITAIRAANGTALSVDWGDGTKDLPAVSSTTLSHTYATAASYTIDMLLTGTGTPAEQKGTVVISAVVQPTLSATLPTAGTAGTAVSITGIAAANGTALSVNWGDGSTDAPAVTATSLTHTYATAASYTIDMVLTGTGTPAEKKGTIVISAVAQPTLAATLPTTGTTGTAVSITAITAANGTALSVDWGDGTKDLPAVSSTTLSHTYATAASYTIDMVLTGTGTPAEQKGSVVISAATVTTLAATLPTAGTAGTAVSITGISATNGTALSVTWGDGATDTPAVTATSLAHTYATAGSYTIDMVLSGSGTPANQTGTVVISAPAPTGDLFINRYISGSSNNKGLEIYNPTGTSVNLSFYVLELWSNGAGPSYSNPVTTQATPTATLHLSGTLPAGGTVEILNNTVVSTATGQALAFFNAAQASGAAFVVHGQDDTGSTAKDVTSFNGDDVVLLLKSTTADPGASGTRTCVRTASDTAPPCASIDTFGVLGLRPTTSGSGATAKGGWNSSTTAASVTVAHTLHRQTSIVTGHVATSTGTDPYWDPTAVDYDAPLGSDVWTGLGSR